MPTVIEESEAVNFQECLCKSSEISRCCWQSSGHDTLRAELPPYELVMNFCHCPGCHLQPPQPQMSACTRQDKLATEKKPECLEWEAQPSTTVHSQGCTILLGQRNVPNIIKNIITFKYVLFYVQVFQRTIGDIHFCRIVKKFCILHMTTSSSLYMSQSNFLTAYNCHWKQCQQAFNKSYICFQQNQYESYVILMS